MADVIRLANKSQSSTINLLSGVFEFEDLTNVWPFLMGSDGINPLSEVFPLIGEDTLANLRTAENALHRVFRKADAWERDKLLAESWWIEWNQDGESVKRCLIMPNGRINQVLAPGITPQGNEEQKRRLRMQLTRHPLFESVAASTANSYAELSVIGGQGDIALADGTAPARIASLTIEQVSFTGLLETIWVGIRPLYQSPAGSFTAVWELEDGTPGTDTAVGTDAKASGGATNNMVADSFGTRTTLVQRGRITVGDVLGSNYTHMTGRYLVLMRVKTTAPGTTFGVQLRQGYVSAASLEEVKPPEYITPDTNTDFYLVDLGIVTIGNERDLGSSDISNHTIAYYVDRLAGSGSLRMDCLIFIPADHMVKLENGSVASDGSAVYYTHENDEYSARQYNVAGQSRANLIAAPTNFYIPIIPNYGGQLVVAATIAGGVSELTDTISVDMEHVERWISYRTS